MMTCANCGMPAGDAYVAMTDQCPRCKTTPFIELDDELECEGHPDDDWSIRAGMPSGETHYCDGSCRGRR